MQIISKKIKIDGKRARRIRWITIKKTDQFLGLIENKGKLIIVPGAKGTHDWQTVLQEGETILEIKYQKIVKRCREVIAQEMEDRTWEGIEYHEI